MGDKNEPSYCTLLDEISRIVHRKGGALPGFHEGHVIAALNILLKEEVAGRKRLSQLLSIGETSVRSLIRRLVDSRLVEVDKVAGAVLTEYGIKVAKEITRLIKVAPLDRDVLGFGWRNMVVIMLADTPPSNTNAVIIRDKAISVNAEAIIIAVIRNNNIDIPGLGQDSGLFMELRSKLWSLIRECFGFSTSPSNTSILYAALKDGRNKVIEGYRLGYAILRHYCLRSRYC